MEGLAVIGFVFGMVGVIALVRLEKLIKTLIFRKEVVKCQNLRVKSLIQTLIS